MRPNKKSKPWLNKNIHKSTQKEEENVGN